MSITYRHCLALALIALVTSGAAPARKLPSVRPNPNLQRAGVLHGGVLFVTLEAKESAWHLDTPRRPPMTIEAFSEHGRPPLLPGPQRSDGGWDGDAVPDAVVRRRAAARGAVTLVAVAALAAGALAACGPTSRSRMATPPVVRFVAHEYAFDAPDSIDAGPTTLRLISRGKELHFLGLVRIDSGHTTAELFDAIAHQKPRPWVTNLGGVGTVSPGDSAESIVDLSPGVYAVLCDITARDGVPHFMKGMFKSFTVTTRRNGAAMPDVDATVVLSEYAFTMPDTLRAGSHVVEVRNTGAEPHMALLWRLHPGKSAQDVVRWYTATDTLAARPIELVGGVPDVGPGQRVDMRVGLAPGNYLLICLVGDSTASPHFMRGMIRQLTVAP